MYRHIRNLSMRLLTFSKPRFRHTCFHFQGERGRRHPESVRYVTRRLAADQAIPSTSNELEPWQTGRDTVVHKGAARVKATKGRVLRQWPHKCVREGGRWRGGAKARGCTCFSVHHAACHPRYFTAPRTVLCMRGTRRPRGSMEGFQW